ncbi:c-type cytochrome biogenesis protein CcmI [Paracoccus sp. (in: a-proteobacteria)]|uniref:c-type cytochrome biogenesis protein CcmI n=1 Tax=Paracoccus sp. TaxID=267 RepID=UPI00396C8BEE
MFWILAAGLTAIVAYVILSPVLRARAGTEPAAAYDLRVYRDQLREVDRDLERRVIRPDDAERLRAEIGRKVLDADKRLTQATPVRRPVAAAWPALFLLAVLGAGVALYLREGVPGAPDMPMNERVAAADAAYRNRPSQAEAEAAAPARPQPDLTKADPEYLAMIEQLREAVARNPDDQRGQELLATHELRLGNLPGARQAQDRVVALKGDQVTAVDLMQQASLMIEAAGGIVTPEAEAVLTRTLDLDRDQPQARYLRGVLLIQNGRPDQAFPIWSRLLEEGPPDAPWIPSIRGAIEELAWLAGRPDDVPPIEPSPETPGPDADALAAAEDMDPAERARMIEGMVSGLQERLATEGGSPDEWARLIGALGVLGRTDQAAAIWNEAQTRFGPTPEALTVIRDAAENAGVAE